MFKRIKELWNDKGFEIIVLLSVCFIILYSLYRKISNKKGTWSEQLYIPTVKQTTKPHRPKDSRGELECRRVLEKLFNRPFNKARPNFLNNPVTGGNFNLELDCYNKDLKLAVEYNGAQHYKYIPYFHKNMESFHNQKYRDYMKQQMCKDNGIILIEVPYTIPVENIEKYLISELKNKKFF